MIIVSTDRPYLDYNSDKEVFGLIDRRRSYVHGWAGPSVSGKEGIHLTKNPYRAFSYVGYATPAAQVLLKPIFEGIQEARASDLSYVDPTDIRFNDCVPEGQKLMEFQVAGVAALLNRKSAFLADEPGLGKTPQTICYANIIKPAKFLVICPASLTLNWEREFETWLSHDRQVTVFEPGKSKLDAVLEKDTVIISYDSIVPRAKDFIKAGFTEFVACDEAHYLKSEKALRTKTLMCGENSLLKLAERLVLISGTPSPNKIAELVPFIRHLRPDLLCGAKVAAFKTWFFRKEIDYFSGKTKLMNLHPECELEFKTTVFADWLIRREKKDVLTQLPAKRYHLAVLSGGKEFDVLIDRSEALGIEDIEHIPGSMISAVAEVRHAIGVAKAPLVVGYIKDLLEGGTEKVVVFAHHRAVIDVLAKGLAAYSPGLIVGGMTAHDKDAAVQKFQNSDTCRVIICNIVAGGVGVTLTRAHDVVFAEASYVPGENEQAIDRIHRISQTERVTAHFPSVPGTIDFNVLKAFLTKKKELEFYNN